MFFGARSIIFETLFVFAGKITFRFSPRALFDLPDLYDSDPSHPNKKYGHTWENIPYMDIQ